MADRGYLEGWKEFHDSVIFTKFNYLLKSVQQYYI